MRKFWNGTLTKTALLFPLFLVSYFIGYLCRIVVFGYKKGWDATGR